MFCIKCGGSVPTTARFCPACGSSVVDSSGAAAPAKRPPQSGKKLIAVIAGIAIVCAVVAAVMLHARRQQQDDQTVSAAAAAPQSTIAQSADPQTAAPSDAVTKPAQTIEGFDWSGLSPEELLAARQALDAAIAKEEQNSAKNAGASQPAGAPSTP
jgi:hypothetical protein